MKRTSHRALPLPVLLLMGALSAVAGCSLEAPDDPTALANEPGVEDAGARYVAVGDGYTAGFMDGGLMSAGQMYSFPNLIAGQLGLGDSQFTQPWIASPGIGNSTPSDPANVAGVLYFNGTTLAVLGETPRAEVPTTLLLASRQPTQYHNLGVPGATLHDAMNAYSSTTCASFVPGNPQTANPFFDFINRSTLFGNKSVASGYPSAGGPVPVTYQSASQFYQSVAKGGALTTLWLGLSDVLGPAMSGEPPAGFGPASAAAFQADYTALLAMLAGGLTQRNNGLQPTIVVANLPGLASLPYFVPKTVFEQAIGGGWPGGYEEAGVQYVRFPALTWVQSHATSVAIPDEYTLDVAETTDVSTAIGTYNQIIAAVHTAVHASGAAKVGLVDVNALFGGLTAPQKSHFLILRGAGMTVEQAAAATMFSLDGINPNSHGHGLIANAFIEKINELDDLTLAPVDPAALPWDPTYGQSPGR